MTEFRIIPTETHTAALNMAYDEACMEAVRKGTVPPTIRLYRWKPSAITIGYFQCLADELDVEACKKDGIDIVRRQTGGGAVYHDAEGEVTYSIIAPEHLFSTDIIESYKEICQCIIDGLASIGVTASFRPINDLIIGEKKCSGNAQTRKGGVLLQHGTILLTVDAETMFTYLTPDKSKISDKPFIKSVKSAVTSVSEHTDTPREQIEAAIRNAFAQKFSGKPGAWTEDEQDRAKELALEKYSQESWNAMR